MLLTSFKSEIDAFATPPQFIFQPTLENYLHINERSDYFAYAWNSLLISSSATLLCMLVAVPAAYSMAFFETRHTKRTLLWMLSTKMLPPVGVLMPIYLLAKQFGLLDSRLALIIVYTLINLPIVVWMVYTYFRTSPWTSSKQRAWTAPAPGRRSSAYCCRSPRRARLDPAAVADPVLERGLLVAQPDLLGRRPADRPGRLLFQPEGLFWAKLSGRLHPRLRADPGLRLDQPEAAGTRPFLRRREMKRIPILSSTEVFRHG